MKKVLFTLFLIISLFFVLSSEGLAQRLTGSIRGKIADEEGNPLPGVTVNLASPALQGRQTFITSADGNYRFPVCPPGKYTIKTELSGFQTIERTEIIVRVGITVDVDVQMKISTMQEEIIVMAPTPMVDTQSYKSSITVTSDLIKDIPVRRNIVDLYRLAPGTVGEAEMQDYRKSASVHGGGLHQSKYTLDGVDLVDPQRGYIAAADIAFDAIEEVEISVGGHKAEVGQVSAGHINVVSKSGGNKLSGGMVIQGTTKDFAQNIVPRDQLAAAGLDTPIFYKYLLDTGMTLGGPILRDRLWFFISPRYADRVKKTFFVPYTDPEGIYHGPYDFRHRDYELLGKFTGQITKKLKWMGMYQYSYYSEEPDIWLIEDKFTPAESLQYIYDNTHSMSQIFTYVIDQNTFAEARFGYTLRKMDDPISGKWEGPANRPFTYDEATGHIWGSLGWAEEHYLRQSFNVATNLTRFQDNLFGMEHEFKVGLEYARGTNKNEHPRFNPYTRYWWNGTPWSLQESMPYLGYFEIDSGERQVGDMPRKSGIWRLSAFIQDTLSIGKRLTLSLGLRYDTSHGFREEALYKGWTDTWYNGLANILLPEIFSTQDMTSPALDNIIVYKMFSPRVGASYDLFGTGKTAIKASFSRYAEILIGDCIRGMDPFGPRTIGFTWYDANKNGILDLPPVDSYLVGGYSPYAKDPEAFRKLVDPGLSSPYHDEWMAGVSHELGRDFSLTLSFSYKVSKNFVGLRNLVNPREGDMWLPYTITDPGPDGTFGTNDEQDLTVYALKSEAAPNFLQKQNISEARRKYWGMDLIFFKRMSNNWQFSGSLTYSKSYGNYPDNYISAISGESNWWNPNEFLNRSGRLSFDRPLIIKLMGTVILPFKINLSAYYRYFSGSPWNRTLTVYFPGTVNGFVPKSRSVVVKAESPGTRRTIPENIVDMRIEKTFKLGPGTLGLWIDVFNLFSYYAFSFYQDAGGYIFPDGSFARYPRFGEVTGAKGSRTINLALRYNF